MSIADGPSLQLVNAPSPRARLRALVPWLVSLAIVAYVAATQDLHAVAAAFGRANLVAYAAVVTAFAITTLLVDAWFLTVNFRWLARVGSYWGLVQARGAVYLLTILNAFVGLGGLVVYAQRRWRVSYQRGSGIIVSELVHEVGTLGLLAMVGAWLTPTSYASRQVDACADFGLGCVIFYVAIFVISRCTRWQGGPHHAVFGVFAETSTRQFGAMLAIKVAQNIIHGLFVVLALSCFGIAAPPLLAFGLSQIVRIVRGLPVSAFGLGVDQLTFPILFGAFDEGDGRMLAFSIAYTSSMLTTRGVLGLGFMRGALRALPKESPHA